ncbi:hypothetical protein [Pseudomonas sp. LP_7_YM]|uniref:hypothetical protein n=1 Tax=Pseudomonas sp. LP_7_YM TaxID=2485137 RepID=UPI0021146D65|nr:hypothetical protein [Pseudomonas sp. LP_7_YM]
MRSRFEYPIHCRIVGHAESSQQLRHGTQTAPFGASEQFGRKPLLDEQIVTLGQAHYDIGVQAFSQSRQVTGIKLDVAFRDAETITGVEAVNMPGSAFDEIRVGAQRQEQAFKVCLFLVPEAQLTYEWNGILVRGETDFAGDQRLNLDVHSRAPATESAGLTKRPPIGAYSP